MKRTIATLCFLLDLVSSCFASETLYSYRPDPFIINLKSSPKTVWLKVGFTLSAKYDVVPILDRPDSRFRDFCYKILAEQTPESAERVKANFDLLREELMGKLNSAYPDLGISDLRFYTLSLEADDSFPLASRSRPRKGRASIEYIFTPIENRGRNTYLATGYDVYSDVERFVETARNKQWEIKKAIELTYAEIDLESLATEEFIYKHITNVSEAIESVLGEGIVSNVFYSTRIIVSQEDLEKNPQCREFTIN